MMGWEVGCGSKFGGKHPPEEFWSHVHRQMSNRVERRNNEKTPSMAVLSHQLRHAMTCILGQARHDMYIGP